MPVERMTAVWKRSSIKVKILLICGSLIALRLIHNASYFSTYHELERFNEFQHHVHDVSLDLYRLNGAVNEAFYSEGALPQVESVHRFLTSSEASLASLIVHHHGLPEFGTSLHAIKEEATRYYSAVHTLLGTPEYLSLQSDGSLQRLGALTTLAGRLFHDAEALNNAVTLYTQEKREGTFRALMSMGAAIFLISLLFLVFLYRGVMGPLKLLGEMRRLINLVQEKGDFTPQLQGEGPSEVGLLARDFNGLMRTLEENLGTTAETVGLVARNVERLANEVHISRRALVLRQHELVHVGKTLSSLDTAIADVGRDVHMLTDTARAIATGVDTEGGRTDGPPQLIEMCNTLCHTAAHIGERLAREAAALSELHLEIEAINTIEGHAQETAATITTASDELLYLSYLLRCEVCKFHKHDEKLCGEEVNKERCRHKNCKELLLQLGTFV